MSSRPPAHTGDKTAADVTGAADRSTMPADANGDAAAPTGELPRNERRYSVVGEHKAGGQGRIMEAEDRWLHRRVALKEPLGRGTGSEARFLREAMVTARLQHPAIVPVYDAGRDAQGRPFFAMKMVHGRSLRDVIGQRKALDDRLALLPNVLAVVDAIAYAHSQGVIHRDLKPSNVLIGPFGETVVIDWGLAKTLDEPDEVNGEDETDPASRSSSDLTRAGDVVGTPQYMAPEQAAGQAADERADVYALGAMLYELLCGDAPYPVEGAKVLEAVIAAPPEPIAKRQPGVPEDLAAIVGKAMARRREERYPSATQLGDDLRRFQTGQLLASRRYSPWQRAQRWVAKHRALVAFLLLLATTVSVAGWRVVGERNRVRHARDLLLLAQARQALARDPTLALAWLRRYPPDGAHADEARALAMDAVMRGVSWRVWRLEDAEEPKAMFNPNGKQFAVHTRGLMYLFDMELWDHLSAPYHKTGLYFATDPGGETTLTDDLDDMVNDVWPGQGAEPRKQVEPCPDAAASAVFGDWVACGGEMRVDLEFKGMRTQLLGHARPVTKLSFSAKGALLGSVSDRMVRIWRVSPSTLGSFVANEVARAIQLSPDGRTLAVLREGSVLVLLDVASRNLRCGATNGVVRMAWAPHSRTLALATTSGLRLLEATTCKLTSRPTDAVDLAWQPDGDQLASVDGAGNLVIGKPTGEETKLPGHYAVAFSPDGKHIATGGNDLNLHLLDLAGGERKWTGHKQPIERIAFAAQGGWVASLASDGLLLWNEAGQPTVLATEHARDFEFSPDGRWLAGAFDGAIRLYELPAPHGVALAGSIGRADKVHFSSDGNLVAAASDGGIRIWDVRSHALVAIFRQQEPVRDLAFLPGGTALISAGATDLRRFALADAQPAPQDPAALAHWIDQYSSATLEVLAPESPLEPEDTH